MKLLALNTIGLTGAEILAAHLSRFDELFILPGQNFIMGDERCYRPHHYADAPPEKIFENLSRHHFTRSGHCWSGMTKSMRRELRDKYSAETHRAAFIALSTADQTTIGHFTNFALSLAQAIGRDLRDVKYFGFFGNNLLLNAAEYPDLGADTPVIDFTNPPAFWLANIGQRMVWDNLVALKFWIVNRLFVRFAAQSYRTFIEVDIEEFCENRLEVDKKICAALSIAGPSENEAGDGYIQFSQGHVDAIRGESRQLDQIYRGSATYQLATEFDAWSPAFLKQPEITTLLERYGRFWNTTSHTNFDWIGPIEEEILERALAFVGVRSSRNLSRWFYHECYSLQSDSYEQPTGRLEHFLGCLEEEIVVPRMPYYARVIVFYLSAVAKNYLKRGYSAVPIRSTLMYRTIMEKDYAAHFERWGMTDVVAQMEAAIDAADEEIAKYQL